MALSSWISVIRWIIIFLTAATFGLDMYLLKVFKDNLTVVLHWRYIVQTSIIGTIFWWTLITEIDDSVERGKRRRAVKEGIFQLKRKYRQRSYASCLFFWHVIRLLWYWALCAAMLQVAIEAMSRSFRTVFTLPYNRNTPEADALNWDWSKDDDYDGDDHYPFTSTLAYNPRDLYDCQKYNFTWGQPLTMICNFDQSTLSAACLTVLFAFIESIMTFIHDTRQMRRGHRTDEHELEVGTYHKGIEGHNFHSQPDPLDPVVHAAHNPILHPVVPPLQQRPAYETVATNEHLTRPLPALPPRPSDSVEDLEVSTPAYSTHGSDAAFKEGYAFDKKAPYETVDMHDSDGGVGSSTNPFAGQTSEWPQDIKK
ncbi:hypothetical protein BGZ74_000728 [Mortierella antarctica]|nr:hypothetical protein BGZ74_000728 [Mortierella antarctica]